MVLRPLSDSLPGSLRAARCFTRRLAHNKARRSQTATSDSSLPASRRAVPPTMYSFAGSDGGGGL